MVIFLLCCFWWLVDFLRLLDDWLVFDCHYVGVMGGQPFPGG